MHMSPSGDILAITHFLLPPLRRAHGKTENLICIYIYIYTYTRMNMQEAHYC